MKYCHNCGSNLHITKQCHEPRISCGIILTKLPYYRKINLPSYTKIESFNYKNLKNISKIAKYSNKIKFLLIRRKHSLNYIEFIRGKYDISNLNHLKYIFELMSPEEISKIGNSTFKKLWEDIWRDKSWCKSFIKEYEDSENKFNLLKKDTKLFKFLTEQVIPKYNCPEWGLPKGRREMGETNLQCGIREFCEETSLTKEHFHVIENLSPLTELYLGTNDKYYKSYFFLSTMNRIPYEFNIENNLEIGDIGFFTLNQANEIIRDYYFDRIKILEKIFLFIVNILESDIKKSIKYQKKLVI